MIFSQADSGTDPDAIRDWARTAEDSGLRPPHGLRPHPRCDTATARSGPGGQLPERALHDGRHLPRDPRAVQSPRRRDDRTEFVTSVLVLPQRQAALAAKQIATIHLLSGGRIRVAVGVGWNWAEYEGLGADFEHRTAVLDEQIDVMRALWTEPHVDFDGTFHHLDGVGINPRPEGLDPDLHGHERL